MTMGATELAYDRVYLRRQKWSTSIFEATSIAACRKAIIITAELGSLKSSATKVRTCKNTDYKHLYTKNAI